MDKWYYLSGPNLDIVTGPCEEKAMLALFESGQLDAGSQVCKVGNNTWTLAAHTIFSGVARPPQKEKVRTPLPWVKIGAGIGVTLVMAVLILGHSPSSTQQAELPGGVTPQTTASNSGPSAEIKAELYAGAEKSSCSPASKDLLKAIEVDQGNLAKAVAQLQTLAVDMDKQKASIEAINPNDPSAPTAAKINAMRGAYDIKLGKYQRHKAKYDVMVASLNEKIRQYEGAVSDFEACVARAAQQVTHK